MIAKHIPMRTVEKSSIKALIAYLTGPHGKAERVGRVTITNCHSTDPQVAAIEIKAIQDQNKRTKSDKTYHLLVSFPSGENPPPEVLAAIEDRICEGLGYGEHQRVSVVHTDTDNLHLHLCINRIHPERLTVHKPYYAYKILGRLCTKLEIEYGLQRTNHTAKKTVGEAKAEDMEAAAGLESLISWIRRQCMDDLLNAKSWAELHKALAENGLSIKLQGNGLVIANKEGLTVKASSVSRECSKAGLESRLGRFEPALGAPAPEPPKRRYHPRPIPSRVDTSKLYAEYQAEREAGLRDRGLEWKRAKETKERRIEQAKSSARTDRSAVRIISGRFSRKLYYSQVSGTLKTEIAKIRGEYALERQAIYDRYKRRTWNDWLQVKAERGNMTALEVLRSRQGAKGLKGDTIGNKAFAVKHDPVEGLVIDFVTKQGTVVYRYLDTTIRDDGKLVKVGQGAGREVVQVALQIARERFGKKLTVNGSAEFKNDIVGAAAAAGLAVEFDDPELERRRIALAGGKKKVEEAGVAVSPGIEAELEHPGHSSLEGRPIAPMGAPDLTALKYIEERNGKRGTIIDILEHRPFCPTDAGELVFRGLREVDGQTLGLFEKQKQILVLPINHWTAVRLKRLHRGDPVKVTAEGKVKSRSLRL